MSLKFIVGQVTGKLFCGKCAVVEYKNRWIAIVGESVEDIERMWKTMQIDSPDLPDLDTDLIQEVVIGARANVVTS